MKKLIALIAVLLIIGSVLAGCESNKYSIANKSFDPIDVCYAYGTSFYIVYQTETKVMYSVSTNGALTLLVNPDGTPMIYHGE